MLSRLRVYLLCLVALLTLSACSLGSSDVTPETRMAVLRISDEYLRNLAKGQSGQAESMIGWPDYGPAVDDEITRDSFAEIVKSKKDRWSKEEHPLLGLDVKKVEIDDDEAEVLLVKKTTNQKIEIELRWVGRGWLIVNDNILSKNGIFRKE